MRRRPSVITVVGLPLIALVLLPALTNIATGALPEKVQPFLWLAWPLALLLAIPVVIAEARARRRVPVVGIGPKQPEAPAPGGVIWNVPPVLRTFVGRQDELHALECLTAEGAACAAVLSGLAGVGKTQLAAAYAAAHRGAFDLGWWVAAENRLAVVTSLAQLADLLGVGAEDQETAAHAVVRELSGRSRWLLVFDNVTDEQDVTDLVPSGAGRVLVTSRDPGLARLGTVVPMEPFPGEIAARFLLDRTGDADVDAAARLADEVGGLPLALEQAAAYCVSSGVGLAGYLERYRGDRSRLMRQGAPPGRLAVQATLALSVREAGRRDPAAVQLLRLCAFFAGPAGIPRWLVTAEPARLPKPLSWAAQDLIHFDSVVAVLVRLALVQADNGLLRVHPLVQDLLVDQIGRTGRARRWSRSTLRWRPGGDRTAGWDVTQWVRLGADLALAPLSGDPGDPAGWGRWAAVLSHASRLLQQADQIGLMSVTNARLRNDLALYLWRRGEYADARVMVDRAYQEFRQVLNDEHPEALTSLNNLALVLGDQGDFGAANNLHRQALQVKRRVLGEEHPSTLTSMNNLANVLQAQGDPTAAHHLHQQVLQVSRRILGDEHPDTLTSMNNLANALQAQGDPTAAHHLHQQVLQTRRRVLGDEHPDTLTSMNNLAVVLRAQGDLTAAHDLHQQELETCRRVLGDGHPDTLISMNNFADVLEDLGRQQEADRLRAEVRRHRGEPATPDG